MSGYYVRRQGDDSDYLEHGIFGAIGEKAHKYLAKLPTPGGGFRYIYSQAELAAARAGNAISSVRRKAADAIGLTARSRMKTAERVLARSQRNSHGQPGRYSGVNTFSRNARKARERYSKTLLGRAENAANAARNAIGKAVGNARKTGEGVIGSIKKEAYRVGGNVSNAVSKATGLSARNRVSRLRESGNQRAADQAQQRYNKTLLGRAENAFNSARKAVGGAAGKARNAVGQARTKGAAAINAAVGAGRGAATQVRNAVGNAAGKARNAGATAINTVSKTARKAAAKAGNASGLNARKAYQNAYDDYQRAVESGNASVAANQWRRAQKRYNAYSQTPMGRAENAVKSVSQNVYFKTKKKKKA
jgi:hypothetical protein